VANVSDQTSGENREGRAHKSIRFAISRGVQFVSGEGETDTNFGRFARNKRGVTGKNCR